jgi:hypothetical protein
VWRQVRAIATQQLVPKPDAIAAFGRVRSWPILPQGIEHNLADRLAGLARQGARELRGFGVTDVNLIPHGCFSSARSRASSQLVQMYLGIGVVATRWPVATRAIAFGIGRESYSNRLATAAE